jgi:hypothetical protein
MGWRNLECSRREPDIFRRLSAISTGSARSLCSCSSHRSGCHLCASRILARLLVLHGRLVISKAAIRVASIDGIPSMQGHKSMFFKGRKINGKRLTRHCQRSLHAHAYWRGRTPDAGRLVLVGATQGSAKPETIACNPISKLSSKSIICVKNSCIAWLCSYATHPMV